MNAVCDLFIEFFEVRVNCAQVDQSERAQYQKEDVAEVHFCVLPEDNQKCGRLNEDKDGADVGSERVILEVNPHVLDSLGVPFELAEFNYVLVVHLGWAQHRANVPQAEAQPDKEENQAEAICHQRELDTGLQLGHSVKVLIGHTRDRSQNQKVDHVDDDDHHDSGLEAEDATATASLRDLCIDLHHFKIFLKHLFLIVFDLVFRIFQNEVLVQLLGFISHHK